MDEKNPKIMLHLDYFYKIVEFIYMTANHIFQEVLKNDIQMKDDLYKNGNINDYLSIALSLKSEFEIILDDTKYAILRNLNLADEYDKTEMNVSHNSQKIARLLRAQSCDDHIEKNLTREKILEYMEIEFKLKYDFRKRLA